jgi:DNA-binding CsgD family transcriptional regulator
MRVVKGWRNDESHVCTGAVRDTTDAAEALLAAVAGAGLIVHAQADRDVIYRLVDDLRRLGEAAAELHLSRRTADRRLASARDKLGVATTPEAVVAYALTR